jgi:putative endonuclease
VNANKTWFCYILHCGDDSYYTGITTDLTRRIKQHQGELSGGAKYTAARRPVKLVAYWEHADRSNASKHEYQIKKLTRVNKQKLFKAIHPSDSPLKINMQDK